MKQKFTMPTYVRTETVEEEHPLKQGLKQGFLALNNLNINVEEEHPLKQGLKHPDFEGATIDNWS